MENCRYFVKSNAEGIEQIEKNRVISFFDFGELGTYSMFGVSYEQGAFKLNPYFNFLNRDNYLLKASAKTSGKDFGAGCVGCTFKLVKTSMNGVKHPEVQTQQPSMSHTRLGLPFVFFGLGRINNYIENFNLGVDKLDSWSFSWSPIIPNSQLLVSPTDNEVSKWKIEIFINPTKALTLIILSTVAVLLVLGLIIVYYHRKEKIADDPSDAGYGFF